MDATKQMLDAVRKVKTKLTKEKNAFNNAMEIVGIRTSSEIDLFSGTAVSKVANIAATVRKASDRLYSACQTQIPLLDAECRPLLDHDPSTKAVKEVTALIQKLNRESEISTNFRGNINGGSFHDLVGVRYFPHMDNLAIQAFWESKYAEMPGTAAEDKAYAARERKEQKAQAAIRTQAVLKFLQDEREEKRQKKLAQEQERQERLERIAQNAEETRKRREYLRRAREMIGVCGGSYAIVKTDGKTISGHKQGKTVADTSEFWGIRAVVCTEEGVVGMRNSGACMVALSGSGSDARLHDVENWHGIDALAAGAHHVVGLHKSGVCVATSFKRDSYLDSGQSKVNSWTEVMEIACGDDFTLGLRKDGTLLYAGPEVWNKNGEITSMTNIAMIAAGGHSVIAVTKTGEILQRGTREQGAVTKAENVVQVAVVDGYPFALQADGTLMGGKEDAFHRDAPMVIDRNVVALYGNHGGNLCYLQEDGTLIEKKFFEKQGTPLVREPLFESYDAHWRILEDADQARQAKVKQILAWRDEGMCQHCGGAFKKSLFGSKCSQCGKKKDY